MSAKIQFSKQEKELVTSTDWILTKQKITIKIYDLFGGLYKFQQEAIKNIPFFSSNLFTASGKIYKGENYLELPYIILDYPAIFKKNDVFFVRTMFWWGNFISITLHVSGNHTSQFANNKFKTLEFLQQKDFFICVNKDEWQHHFKEDNYICAASFSLQEFEKIMEKEFFKISKKISIAVEESAYDFLVKSFEEIIELVNFNCPAGEKDLSPVFPTTGSGL
jgi:hypothetical protein